MDFLIEPVIDTMELEEPTTGLVVAPCCESGSGCKSGMLPLDLEQI